MPLLAVLTVVFFITTILFALMAFRPQSAPINTGATRAAARAEAERSIETVAARFIENLVAYEHTTVDEDVQRMLADATSSVETDFQSGLSGTMATFRSSVRDRQAQSSGEVLGVTVSEVGDDTATVFAIVSQTRRSIDRPERTSLRALELTLLRTDDGWKVDNVANPTQPAE